MTKSLIHPYIRIKRICKLCGEEFRIHSSRQIYCDKCRTHTCIICGETFRASPQDHLRSGSMRRTCSRTCSDKLNSPTPLECSFCGKIYYPDNGCLTRKYCSNECKYKSLRRLTSDPRRTSYEYRAWRRHVFHRDKYICQECDATKNLQAHHIKPWEDYPELRYEKSNGITMCQSCHSKVHGSHTGPTETKRLECTNCKAPITGTGKSSYCRSCAMQFSVAAQTYRESLHRDNSGRFTSSN